MTKRVSAPRWRLARRVASCGVFAVVLLVAWWLWPTRLGGEATVVVVDGHSMEPTYDSGDLVVARHESSYQPGDIIVFSVTAPGSVRRALVVHRLLAIDSDGNITTKGDNRERPDGFALTTADIVGRAQVRVPHGGYVLFLISRWWVLALVVGLLVTTVLWPRSSVEKQAIVVGAPPGDDESRDEVDVLAELDALLDDTMRTLAEQGLAVAALEPDTATTV